MKKAAKVFSVAFATTLAFTCFAACGKTENTDGPYTVTFDANLDGTGLTEKDVTAVKPQTVEKGEKAKAATIVIKTANPEGYAFQYWMTEKTGTEAYSFDTPVVSDITLYAKWSKQVTVNFLFKGVNVDGTDLAVEQKVFSGAKASREDTAAGWKHVDGYYTDEAYTTAYDFNSPVTQDMTIYVKTSGKGLYASSIVGLATSYGDSQEKFDPESYIKQGFSKAEAQQMAADETSITIVGDNYDDQYARVHFGASTNTAWFQHSSANMPLNTPQIFGERDADKMTITYKNLGPCRTLRFYYVVDTYHEDAQNWTHSGGGMWVTLIDTPVQYRMDENGEWATVTIDLAEKTIVDGVSEWGTAHMLMVPRWEFVDVTSEINAAGKPKARNMHLDNDVLIKSITFHA
ncbi:MAG: InlB B-repeat-containing protein [Clostridiales bacterium]|nr:InlB B-repeat-containing protein [Clostridiales bacterium]